MDEKWIEEIRERREKATALADQITVRCRYDHGGGRMYIQMPGEGRNLIGDFYNEGDREFYFYALADIGRLLDEVTEQSARIAELAEAIKIAETVRDNSQVKRDDRHQDYNEGYRDAAEFIVAALRARQAAPTKSLNADSNRCKHNVDLSAICEMCDYETADEGE